MTRYGFLMGVVLATSGCGGPEMADDAANAANAERTAPAAEAASGERASVFDPLVQTLERAEGVQQTVDEHAAEQRRRIEEAQR